MRILALETSGFSGEVALLDGEHIVYEAMLAEGQRTAQSLAPGIAGALSAAGWKPADIQLVAVTIGPGSFTGLRVGVTTAKTFAYAVGCEVLGVDTLDAIAEQAPAIADRDLWAVLDAQRSQLFAKRFEAHGAHWQAATPAQIVDGEQWLVQLGSDLATGAGLKRWSLQLPEAQILPQSQWQPRAATVGKLAWRAYREGRRDDLWKLAPQYLRASAAEEKAADPHNPA